MHERGIVESQHRSTGEICLSYIVIITRRRRRREGCHRELTCVVERERRVVVCASASPVRVGQCLGLSCGAAGSTESDERMASGSCCACTMLLACTYLTNSNAIIYSRCTTISFLDPKTVYFRTFLYTFLYKPRRT